MRVFALCICLLLLGCNAPGPYFGDLPATRVRLGAVEFDVRVRGDLAEAMRVNTQYAPRLGAIAPLAAQAMRQVSGCEVTEIRGDAALVLGLLDCGDGGIAPHRRRAPPAYDCYPVDHWTNAGLGQETVAFDCDPLWR